MGWSGYGLYSGDGTQTLHYQFIEYAIPTISGDKIYDEDWLSLDKTIIPDQHLSAFKKGIPKILKKIKVPKKWDEESAIEWQMLLCLFIDNNLKAPKIIKENGIKATEYLLSPAANHCEEFTRPKERREVLQSFIETAKKLK